MLDVGCWMEHPTSWCWMEHPTSWCWMLDGSWSIQHPTSWMLDVPSNIWCWMFHPTSNPIQSHSQCDWIGLDVGWNIQHLMLDVPSNIQHPIINDDWMLDVGWNIQHLMLDGTSNIQHHDHDHDVGCWTCSIQHPTSWCWMEHPTSQMINGCWMEHVPSNIPLTYIGMLENDSIHYVLVVSHHINALDYGMIKQYSTLTTYAIILESIAWLLIWQSATSDSLATGYS